MELRRRRYKVLLQLDFNGVLNLLEKHTCLRCVEHYRAKWSLANGIRSSNFAGISVKLLQTSECVSVSGHIYQHNGQAELLFTQNK